MAVIGTLSLGLILVIGTFKALDQSSAENFSIGGLNVDIISENSASIGNADMGSIEVVGNLFQSGAEVL